MKVVILAGGYGTRISEESHLKPKPMIEIGEKPILWHIMKEYSFTLSRIASLACCSFIFSNIVPLRLLFYHHSSVFIAILSMVRCPMPTSHLTYPSHALYPYTARNHHIYKLQSDALTQAVPEDLFQKQLHPPQYN